MRTELTIAWLTIRQLLARRRAAPVLLLALLPVIVALIARTQGTAPLTSFAITVNVELIIRIVLPIIALIFGTGAFGAEREESTAVYLLTKPIARWRIALAKLVTVAGLTTGAAVGSSLLTSLVVLRGADPNFLTLGFAAAIAVGSVVYSAVFVALGLFVRRALPVGLIYVVVWEVMAAEMFAGTRTLSVRQYVLTVADRLAEIDPAALGARLPVNTVLVMSVSVIVVAAALSVYRLRGFEVLDQQ